MRSFPPYSLWTMTVPSWMPISENEAVRPGSGSSAWASDWMRPDQFELAAGQEADADRRPHEGHVGDLDPPREQREIAQMRDQLVRDHGRPAVRVVAEQHVVEAHGAGGEQRDRDRAAQHRLKAGDGVNLAVDGIPHRGGGHEKRQRDQGGERRGDHGCNGNREALQASGRGHRTPFQGLVGQSDWGCR